MPKLKIGEQWMKDFGQGVTIFPEQAHQFTDDEAFALIKLHDYKAECPLNPVVIASKEQPTIPAGLDRVWVKYKGCWFAAERQAMFMGTREALQRARANEQRDLLA